MTRLDDRPDLERDYDDKHAQRRQQPEHLLGRRSGTYRREIVGGEQSRGGRRAAHADLQREDEGLAALAASWHRVAGHVATVLAVSPDGNHLALRFRRRRSRG